MKGGWNRRLAEIGLLNLDEFDKYPSTKMPLLKKLDADGFIEFMQSISEKPSFITENRFFLSEHPTGRNC